ncbi:MAG: alpha/beta hydrolase [Acidobacteriota bacterium]|nr:alpha/beta hydrolase [Acidobacteriota bacterium]
MTPDEFAEFRKFEDTSFGRIAYAEVGDGRPVVFLHGVPLSGYHWRRQLKAFRATRRCIAPDLMGLGHTEVDEDQDLSFPAQARMILMLLDELGVDRFDLVANDSGGAVAQLMAVADPQRLRTLTLTNCDVHDNWPPPAFVQTFQLARAGRLGEVSNELIANLGLARSDLGLGVGFENPECVTPELLQAYLGPIAGNEKRQRQLDRYVASMDCQQTVAIHEDLKKLAVPTLIVWASEDVFFPVRWAAWLRDTIPGAKDVIEIPGARLFFCEERAEEVNACLRSFWQALG